MTEYITETQGDRQIVPTTETAEAINPKAGTANAPTREQLLAAYEGRYKQAILDSTEETGTAGANASTNYSYLLAAEGLSVLTEEDLIVYSEGGERPLYLGMPVSSGSSEGIDLAATSANDAGQSHGEDAEPTDGGAEDGPRYCTVPTPSDRELLDTLRERGHAATLPEVASYAGADMDVLGSATLAHYRGHHGYTLLATSAATSEDLDRAANRMEADLIGATFERMLATVETAAGKLISRLKHLGGSSTLEGAVGSLIATGHPHQAARAVIRELHRRGEIRISVSGKAPRAGLRDRRPRFVSLTRAEDGALAKAAKRYGDDRKGIPARLAEAKAARIKDGQDKGFLAPFVPYGGQRLDPIEQRRALYVERRKARFRDGKSQIKLRGVSEVRMALAEFCSLDNRKHYPVEEYTLYSAAAESECPEDFFRAQLKGRILSGLDSNGQLTAKKIISTIFPERAEEILAFLAEGRTMSPQLSEPYNLFSAAARELMDEGKIRHTGKAFVAADPDERKLPTASELAAASEQATEWADEDPDPEPESGPEPHGEDKFACDMAGAHDGRAIATGPQAPARGPRMRRKAAGEISHAIEQARQADGAKANAERATLKARANGAWREALAVHMAGLAAAERLELHLQIHGPQRFERMLEAAEEPDALTRAARTLLDEGRITATKAGAYTRIEAASGHDREELTRSLLRVMARGEVAVPEGTSLARRVRATKAAITREANEPGAGEQSAA